MNNQEKIFLKECSRDEESFQELTQFFDEVQRFRYLSDVGVDGVIITQNGTIVDANETATSILGFDKSEFIGQEFSRFVNQDSQDVVYKKIALKSEDMYEVCGVHKNGSIIPLEVTGRHREYKGINYRISVLRYISKRKVIEENLALAEAKSSAIIESTQDSIYAIDTQYRVTTFNTAFYNNVLNVYGKRLYIGIPSQEFTPKEIFDSWKIQYDKALLGERAVTFEFQFNFITGTSYREVSLSPIFHDGIVTGVAVFGRDITAYKDTEEALKTSQSNISALIENTPDSIWSVDRQYRITAFNSVYNQIFFKRFGRNINPGAKLHELVPAEIFKHWVEFYERAFKGERLTFEYDFVADDEVMFREVSLNPIVSGDEITGVSAFGRDITARKKYEKFLKESEANLTALIENTDAAIWSVDNEYRILAFNSVYNEVFFKRFGKHLSIGAVLAELIPEETYDLWKPMYERAFTGERVIFEFDVIQDGGVRYREVSLNPIFYGNKITGVTAFGRDVTERKYYEKVLKESQANITALFENTTDPIWSIDTSYILLEANTAFREFIQKKYNAPYRPGLPVFVGTVEENNFWKEKIDEAFKGKRIVFDIEFLVDDSIEYFEIAINPILHDGIITGASLIGRNITERKRNEEALKTSRANLSALVENTRDLIWSVKRNMQLITFNSAFYEMVYLLYNKKIYPGMLLSDVSGDIKEELLWGSIYDKAFNGEKFSINHEFLIGKSRRSAEISFYPVFDDNNNVIHVVIFSRDVTQYKEAIAENNALLESLQQQQHIMMQAVLETQEQERKRIAQDIHDGLGQILAATKLTLKSGLTELQKKLTDVEAEKIQYSVTLLDKAIEEARSISREIMPSSLMTFGLNAALQDLVKTVLKTGKLQVLYNCSLNSKPQKHVEIHLYRIVQELLGNILKHADAGEVIIEIFEDDQFLTLMVQDDGKGFSWESEMMKPGMGLKNILNRASYLGAGINIDSSPGYGCTVSMEIPIKTKPVINK